MEEAEEYGDILICILQKKEWIAEKEVTVLRIELNDYFKRELVITRNFDPHQRWAKEAKDLMKKYVAAEKVDSITLWEKY